MSESLGFVVGLLAGINVLLGFILWQLVGINAELRRRS